MSSRLIKIGDYHHVAVEGPSGREHWLLTDSELTRIRERGSRHTLARPRPSGMARFWFYFRQMF